MIGPKQFVVQEAFDKNGVFSGLYFSWLTPRTKVGISPFAGAEMRTLLAPAARCLPADSAWVKKAG